jgi:hypothetical protein
MSVNGYKLRFYEQDPTVKFAIEFLFTFPKTFQGIIAGGFNQIAVRDYQANQLVKSVGKEKVLALYALRQKRRAYDRMPNVHEAMRYLMILPDESRRSFALRLNEVTAPAYEYLKDCQTFQAIPQAEVLEKMMGLYVQQGSPYVSLFVQAVRNTLKKSMQGKESSQQKAFLEKLKDTRSDLTLKESDRL